MEQGGSAEQMEVSPVEALAFGDRFEDSFTKICYKAHMDKIRLPKRAGHTSDLLIWMLCIYAIKVDLSGGQYKGPGSRQ